MIIDAHTHIFSPDAIAQRRSYAQRDTFFDLCYSHPKATMASAAELIAAMDAAGIDRAMAAGWPWQNHDVCVEQNSWLMEIARQYPTRVIPLAIVQPNAGAQAIRELERCVAGGMVGVGEFNADGQQFRLDDENFVAVARAAASLGVPVLLHTNEPVGHVYPGKGG
jgi:predicted TIM-barrel fold metal-dependent hydrolase